MMTVQPHVCAGVLPPKFQRGVFTLEVLCQSWGGSRRHHAALKI